MTRIALELARQTLRQAWADRLALAWPAYAVGCLALVPLGSHLALGAGTRGAWEIGMLLQWVLAVALGGWLGLRSVGLDLAHRTATLVLAGPVGPATWLAGRALGAALVLALAILGFELIWLVVCAWRGLQPVWALGAAAAGLWLEAALVAAWVALLSTRARPVVAVGAAAGVWVAGHLSREYGALLAESGLGFLGTALYAVIPDLDRLDLSRPLVAQAPLAGGEVALALAYGAAWLVALAALTLVSLARRDLA